MISEVLRIAVCISSFLYTFYVLCNFTYFLSKSIDNDSNDVDPEENLITKTLWTLLVNTTLISAFIFQHSAMASDLVKDLYHKLNIEDVERSIYNVSSAAVLHLLVSNWQPTSWASVWDFCTESSSKLWFVVSAFHIVGWCIVYSGCIMMDISELAGIKQIYYSISGRPKPMAMKSRELQKYFMHMRHPSFTGFLIILWVYPLMSIDRLLLALILTIYMVLSWTIDEDDYTYHSVVIERKQRELSTY